ASLARHQLESSAGSATPPTAYQPSPSGTIPTWNPPPVNFCAASAARCPVLSPLAKASKPSLFTRWMGIASCPRSGWISSSVFIGIRLPVCGRFGKAPAMRRMVGILALALTGCPSQVPTPAPTATATPTPSPSASATAVAHSNGARKVSEETDDYLFEYAYPKEAGQVPALATLLDGRLDKDRAEL